MNLADVMDELGTALDTITGLRVYPYTSDSITPPAAVVALPEGITYDDTYAHGKDSMVLEVTVMVGKVSDRASRDVIAVYANGSGSKSIKATLDNATYTSCDVVSVKSAEFDVIRVASIDYLAAVFTVAIAGSGS
jgi:hypothetical protein